MKNKRYKYPLVSGIKSASLLLIALCIASCADVYDGNEKFESTVQNQQLLSPSDKDIKITASADGSSQTVTWPVVMGASGYMVSLKDVTNPTEPVTVVADSIIDGCSVTFERAEDTNYELYITTLGNKELGNKDAHAATVVAFTTFLANFSTIPDGSDLKEYFDANPIPADSIGKHLVYDLAANGKYTLNGELNFGLQQVTLRTPSTQKATIVYGETAAIATNAGLVLKNIIIDGALQNQSNSSIIELCKEPDEAIKGLTGKDYYNILDPISIINCELENVNGFVFYDNNKKYATQNFLIKNTTIHLTTCINTLASNAIINAYGGGIMHFKMENSTLWTTPDVEGQLEQKYLLRYNNSFRSDRVVDPAVYLDNAIEVAMISSTFYNSFKSGHIANYDAIVNRTETSFNMTKCIFVDCGSGQIPRRFIKNYQSNPTYTWLYNTYWFNGASEVKEDGTGATDYDKSGTILSTDPAFVDPVNGDFTPTGAEQLSYATGDPRWLN